MYEREGEECVNVMYARVKVIGMDLMLVPEWLHLGYVLIGLVMMVLYMLVVCLSNC